MGLIAATAITSYIAYTGYTAYINWTELFKLWMWGVEGAPNIF